MDAQLLEMMRAALFRSYLEDVVGGDPDRTIASLSESIVRIAAQQGRRSSLRKRSHALRTYRIRETAWRHWGNSESGFLLITARSLHRLTPRRKPAGARSPTPMKRCGT